MYQQYYTDVRKIKYMFSQLQTLVRQSITDYRLLIAHVLGMGILSENDEEQIRKASSTNEVIMILTKYWSFIDCGPLDSIVDHVCGEGERESLQMYHEELKAFCQRRIFESSDGGERTERKKLHFALDFNDPAVRRIPGRNLKIAVATIIDCRASDLILHDIGSGRTDPGKFNYYHQEYILLLSMM